MNTWLAALYGFAAGTVCGVALMVCLLLCSHRRSLPVTSKGKAK